MKNELDVFYFSTAIPMHVLFTEDGQMDKRVFLQAWKDIPAQNEVQFTMSNLRELSPGEQRFISNSGRPQSLFTILGL